MNVLSYSPVSKQRPPLGPASLLLGLALATGCATTHEHTFLGFNVEDEPAELTARHDLPPSFRVLALRLVDGGGEGVPPREHIEALPFPHEKLGAYLEGLLEGTGAFGDVLRVQGEDTPSARRLARERGAHLLLEIGVDDPWLAQLERTSDSTWAVLVWLFAGWGTHWWHDQVFELHFRPTARLYDLVSDRPVGVEILPEVSQVEELSFHERTDNAAVYFLTLIWPPGYSPVDAETVAESLLPASRVTVGRPLADLIGRLHEADVWRIARPDLGADAPLSIRFDSPRDGALVAGKTPLRVHLGLPNTLRDLETVRLGQTVLWDRADMEDIPLETSLELSLAEMEVPEKSVELEVKLRDREETVRSKIRVQREVRLRDAVPGG